MKVRYKKFGHIIKKDPFSIYCTPLGAKMLRSKPDQRKLDLGMTGRLSFPSLLTA